MERPHKLEPTCLCFTFTGEDGCPTVDARSEAQSQSGDGRDDPTVFWFNPGFSCFFYLTMVLENGKMTLQHLISVLKDRKGK